MQKTKLFIIHIVLLFFLCAPSQLLAASEENVFFDGDSVSLSFQEMAISKALEKLAAQTDIEFLLDKDLKGTVSARIKNLPMEEAVRRLLNKYNHAMFFRQTEEGGIRLSKVKVFRNGQQATADYMPIKGSGQHQGASSSQHKSAGRLAGSAAAGTTPSITSAGSVHRPISAMEPGRILQEIQESQQAMSMLQHKAQTEEGILKSKISEAKKAVSEGSIDGQAGLEKIKELEGQLVRKNQANAMMLLNNQKNMQELYASVSTSKNQLEIKQEALERENRQKTLMVTPNSNSNGIKVSSRRKRRSPLAR